VPLPLNPPLPGERGTYSVCFKSPSLWGEGFRERFFTVILNIFVFKNTKVS